MAAARAENVPMGATVRERLSAAITAGDGELDLSAIAEVSRRQTHLDDGD